ncbi:MAG: hypothetical protein ACRDRS_16430 [Pseudonocardiaceae bacterium]
MASRVSDTERTSLIWLAGFGRRTVEDIAAMITCARRAREGDQ